MTKTFEKSKNMHFNASVQRVVIIIWLTLRLVSAENVNNNNINKTKVNCNEDESSCVEPLTGHEAIEAGNALYEGELQMLVKPKNGIPGKVYRWPEATVPFVLHPTVFTGAVKIMLAMTQYMTRTCVRFVPRTTEKNYILLLSDRGCYSYVGMIDQGAQPVSLGRGCMYTGTIVHELGHALGFFHEQSRSDRDEYIKIHLENVEPEYRAQFDKLEEDNNVLYNPFDYDGIMLYGEYAFSKDRKSKSMEDINATHKLVEPYDKPGLTRSDVYRINQMYECDKSL